MGQPNRAGELERALRYRPDGQDFVIENGGEFFNRPLYGGNTAFRVDGGDLPEFSLYLPGHGGNLRLGFVVAGGGGKWLHEAASMTTRYRPGTLLYEIRDPLLGDGAILRVEAIALHETEGLMVKLESSGLAGPVEWVAAFGGLHGKRGVRGGDIGTEAVPIGEYFQLQAESCRGNEFEFLDTVPGGFALRAPVASLAGQMPSGAGLALADAREWGSLTGLLDTARAEGAGIELPVVVGRFAMEEGYEQYICLQRVAGSGGGLAQTLAPMYPAGEHARRFADAERHFAALRRQVSVTTPDPYLNAAAAALMVGVDAVWDEPQGVVMHGAIAWRSRLLGWRGPYATDALGWHDRARRHFAYWATRQNLEPIPETFPPPEESTNLARSRSALHSNGDMAGSHYDMNAVYIDALFRHLRWTGDLEFARELWPVIERHLAWERRLFRREFGPEKLPLYEGYAMIWASDDLYYNGGGATHASAYNHAHNVEAARLAELLGEDGEQYRREAELIARGMRELLWMPEKGMFAEYKDGLGLQRQHESAALWSYYHAMDAYLVSPDEGFAMSRYVADWLPRLPVSGLGVPGDGEYFMYASSDWMPYSWSINNVVMGENLHTALGFWQAGLPDDAYRLMKSSLLASMFMGICPGNVGTLNYLDVYRREAQRDFADGGGVAARALVEGLFGLRPDALGGALEIVPGFPSAWGEAALQHPKVEISYRRDGLVDTYFIVQRFERLMELRLVLPVSGEGAGVPVARVNGREVMVRQVAGTETAPRYEVRADAADGYEVTVAWAGERIGERLPGAEVVRSVDEGYDWMERRDGVFEAVPMEAHWNDRVTQIFRNEYRSPRPKGVSLTIPKQGIGAWAGHVNATAEIDDTGLRSLGGELRLPNGVPFATAGEGDGPNVLFTTLWDNYPNEASVPLSGYAKELFLLMAGSTNWMQSRIDNGEVVVGYADGTSERLALRNPDTWWPIDQDYLMDDYQFRNGGPLPLRVDLKTGLARLVTERVGAGGTVPGGAATVLRLRLDPERELQTLTVRTLSNDVVIGLMAATVER